jgi:hypothetical protein
MKEREYSKKITVLLGEDILIDVERLAVKYGLSDSAAIRFLLVEGIMSLEQQGRLQSVEIDR